MRRLAYALLCLLLAAPATAGVLYTSADADCHGVDTTIASVSGGDTPYSAVVLASSVDGATSDPWSLWRTDADQGIRVSWTAGAQVAVVAQQSGQTVTATGGTAYPAIGGWNMVEVRITSATDRAIIADGDLANKGTSAVSQSPDNSRAGIGALYRNSGVTEGFNGTIAWFAIWEGTALTDAQSVALVDGAWPPYVNSAALTHWFPEGMFDGNNHNDVVGGVVMTIVSGSPVKAGHKNLGPWPGMQQ